MDHQISITFFRISATSIVIKVGESIEEVLVDLKYCFSRDCGPEPMS